MLTPPTDTCKQSQEGGGQHGGHEVQAPLQLNFLKMAVQRCSKDRKRTDGQLVRSIHMVGEEESRQSCTVCKRLNSSVYMAPHTARNAWP